VCITYVCKIGKQLIINWNNSKLLDYCLVINLYNFKNKPSMQLYTYFFHDKASYNAARSR